MFSIVFAGLIFTLMILTLSKGVDHVFGDSVISTIPVEKFPQAIVFNPLTKIFTWLIVIQELFPLLKVLIIL